MKLKAAALASAVLLGSPVFAQSTGDSGAASQSQNTGQTEQTQDTNQKDQSAQGGSGAPTEEAKPPATDQAAQGTPSKAAEPQTTTLPSGQAAAPTNPQLQAQETTPVGNQGAQLVPSAPAQGAQQQGQQQQGQQQQNPAIQNQGMQGQMNPAAQGQMPQGAQAQQGQGMQQPQQQGMRQGQQQQQPIQGQGLAQNAPNLQQQGYGYGYGPGYGPYGYGGSGLGGGFYGRGYGWGGYGGSGFFGGYGGSGAYTASRGMVRGYVAGVNYPSGVVYVRSGYGTVALRGSPDQLGGLTPGELVSFPYNNYLGALWVAPIAGAGVGGSGAGLSTFGLQGDIAGFVNGVNKATGLIEVRGQVLRAHPAVVQQIIPGQFVDVSYAMVGQTPWAMSVRPIAY